MMPPGAEPPRVNAWAAARRGTSLTVGTVALTWDRIGLPGRRWRDIVVGALFSAEEALARTAARQGRLAELAERGAVETELGRRAATAAGAALARRLATSPLVNQMVDAQLDRVVRPLVASVLDDVLALLEAEPERVRALIRSQRETMTDEVVARVRGRTAAGDNALHGTVARMLGRANPPP